MADVKLNIDREFKSLMRDLTEEEYAGLEAEIVADGKVRDPILYWMDGPKALVIDGMHRLEIATKHGLRYPSAPKHFKTKQDAKAWIVQHQFNRRNLTEGQRGMYAAKLTALRNGAEQSNGEASEEQSPKSSVDEAAAMAGVSPRNVVMSRKVIEDGIPALAKAVERGEVGISAAAAVAELPEAKQKEIVKGGAEAIQEHAARRRKREAKKREAEKPAAKDKPRTVSQLFTECDSLFGKVIRMVDQLGKETEDKAARDEVADALNMAYKDFAKWRQKAKKDAKAKLGAHVRMTK